jgi:hypothetical protein
MATKTRGSQYTEGYLRYNETHNPVTPGTYLTKVLRGRAKSYGARYEDALVRHLEALREQGVVEVVETVGHARGYKLRAGQTLD